MRGEHGAAGSGTPDGTFGSHPLHDSMDDESNAG
ncbi:hypothetical protein BCSJ1_25928 [Bacillus cereus SJ1]|nr:hypothetical protein BCSJ1_25928 [Bacillus cereus SJ1]